MNPDFSFHEAGQRSPVLSLVAALIMGIVIASSCQIPSTYLVMCTVLMSGLLLFFARKQRAKHLVFILMMILWVVVGMLRTEQARPRTHPLLKSLLNQQSRLPMLITGEVLTPPIYHPAPTTLELSPRPQSPRTTFDLKLSSIQWDHQPLPVAGQLRVSIVGELPQLQAHAQVQLAGHLFAVSLPTNPHEFNYRVYLERHHIDGMFWCDHAEALTLLASPGFNPLTQVKHRVREYLSQLYTTQLGEHYAPLAKSLILGDRSDLPREIEDSFFVTGLTHVLAISGFHMGILWFLLNGILYLLIPPYKLRYLVVLCFLWGFAWLVDTGPPVLRAVIMASLYTGGQYVQRRSIGLTIWSITLLMQLLYDPLALFDLGAQLSFLAVLVIIEFEPVKLIITKQFFTVDTLQQLQPVHSNPIISFLAQQSTVLTQQLLLSLAITIILAPLTILRFYLVSPYSGILTLMIFPLVSSLLLLLFLFPLLSLIPLVSSGSVLLIQSLVDLTNLLVTTGGNLPGSYLRLPPLPEWWTLGIYAILICYWFLLRVQPFNRGRLNIPFATMFVITFCAGPLYSLSTDRQQHGQLQITALDVGHGGAILLQFPNRRLVLYDCGSITGPERAQRAVLAGLRDLGATKLDAIIISHSDLDHFNGISALVKTVAVDNIYVSPSLIDLRRRGLATTINSISQQGIKITPLQTGDQLMIDSQVEVKVLHPTADPAHWKQKDNENSLVIKLSFAGKKILLTGDIEGEASRELTFNQTEPLDLLFAPHHGSKFANTPPFAVWSQPEIVIICQDDPLVVSRMQNIYQASAEHILSTGDGACRLTITPMGKLQLSQFHPTDNSPDWKILRDF